MPWGRFQLLQEWCDRLQHIREARHSKRDHEDGKACVGALVVCLFLVVSVGCVGVFRCVCNISTTTSTSTSTNTTTNTNTNTITNTNISTTNNINITTN